MRNNSGVLINPHTGRPVRFGLGNDSSNINRVFKSPDLIGITQKTCRCGEIHGIFTGLEIKIPGWKFSKNNQVHIAQNNFLSEIRRRNGIADFISSPDDLNRILNA
jgi:hypothetical protein